MAYVHHNPARTVAEFDRALAHIEGIPGIVITQLSESAQDVTDQFYDMESRLAARLVEEERVLAFIDEAENIQELLALERRLADIRTQIRTYESQMTHLADRAAFSTILAELREVPDYTQDKETPTLGERIASAFGNSASGTLTFFQEILIILATAIIPLAFLGVVAFAAIRIIKKKRTK